MGNKGRRGLGYAGSREKHGGAEGYRTLGLMTASHALSQLSYSPTNDFSNLHVEKFPLLLVNVVRHDVWDDTFSEAKGVL